MSTTTTTTTDIAEDLRRVADWFDRHPEFKAALPVGGIDIHLPGVDAIPPTELARRLRDGADHRRVEKRPADLLYMLESRFGQVRLAGSYWRDKVCRKVVCGVEKVVVPAVEAQPERIAEREVVEWVCDDLLGQG